MASTFKVKPTHKAVKSYYAALATYADQSVEHEGALRSAFQNLLSETGRKVGWSLIPELSLDANGHQIRPDGTFRDEFTIERGYWEAKDTDDDLEAEIKKKIKRGYRLTNTIFEDTREGRLYQDGKLDMIANLRDPQQLCDLLNAFFSHTEPAHEDFNKAVDEFKQRVPDLARGLVDLIKRAHDDNPRFATAFGKFYELCQQSLNPNLSTAAVDEMLVQHLLTERLIRTVFDNEDFIHRNVIAVEIETVIAALVSKSYRRQFLKGLDRFYVAIEQAARTLSGFAEKQHFLNIVYERFFQGYSVKVADTHGIVYTPQEIVDFMCASVAEVLETEFGKKLGDPEVNILDPCTGTGNFIVNLIRRVPKRSLPRMYREQLFANEVMLLPYYIAALNIEHAYYEQTGQYEPFEGLCFVDTLDLAEGPQRSFGFMTQKNVQRVERQRKTPITVIIGNPPYNANQLNENDNNKNRTYEVVDERLKATYARSSTAKLKNKLYDPYVKFFRWAADRIGDRDGIVCLVSNNSFVVDGPPFDGMRTHLEHDFATLLHVDLHGNVRRNPKLSGTTHNVFGIQVGVGITVAIRKRDASKFACHYHRVPEDWRREQKLSWLSDAANTSAVRWRRLCPDKGNNWLVSDHQMLFDSFLASGGVQQEVVFERGSPGAKSNRDRIVYDYRPARLLARVRQFVDSYNGEVDRLKRAGQVQDLDEFLDSSDVKWSSTLKNHLKSAKYAQYEHSRLRVSLYRPFSSKWLYYDDVLIDRPGLFREALPNTRAEAENTVLCCTNHSQVPFVALVTNRIANEAVGGRAGTCFPFYIYDEDGTNRRENVTDWALKHFREHYGDRRITKWDIFYYVYGVLHHPGYREKFGDNLKRELPRIPLAPPCDPSRDHEGAVSRTGPLADACGSDRGARAKTRAGTNDSPGSGFRTFAKAGKKLAKLHLEYESLEPWPLEWIEESDEPLGYVVEKMKLSKDKKSIEVNDSLTLAGIPPEVFEYRLGNRSAIEWVIDQYRVKEDKRTGIRSDPNNPDDREYIVRLVGQVVRVSVETVKIVNALPAHYAPEPTPSAD